MFVTLFVYLSDSQSLLRRPLVVRESTGKVWEPLVYLDLSLSLSVLLLSLSQNDTHKVVLPVAQIIHKKNLR